MLKTLLFSLTAFISCSATASVIEHGDLLTFPSRPGVTQSIYIQSPDPHPAAVILAYSGGEGILALNDAGPTVARSNFVIRTSSYWIDHGYAVVLVDAPSDMAQRPQGMEDDFRGSAKTLADQKAVFDQVRKRFPAARLVLFSTSRGTVTAGNVLQNHPDWADLYVLTSAESSGPTTTGISDLKVPGKYRDRTLMVANRNDICVVAKFYRNERLAKENSVKFIPEETSKGGGDKKKDCGPMSPHGYLGGETKVLNDINDWITPALQALPR